MERLASLTPAARAAALRVLVSRPEATRALLDGIDAGKAQITDLTQEQKQALAAHPDRAIAGRVKKLLERGGLPSADREKVVQEVLPLLAQMGDAEAGKAPALFEASDARLQPLGPLGARQGAVAGSFMHLIDRTTEPEDAMRPSHLRVVDD